MLDEPTKVGGNVHLQVVDITRALVADLPDVVADLVELATYVYCADQAVPRGGKAEFEYGEHWRRRLRFQVPVRRPDVWRDPGVLAELARTLSFLSDDEYEFGFVARPHAPPFREYLFGEGNAKPGEIDTVMLFSGGLDSLAGAVDEVIGQGRRVALVSHRPVGKIDMRQRQLADSLGERAIERGRACPFHISVLANKRKHLGREYTQRTRSFLFGAFGVAVARLFGLDTLRFYENGVVSLNLPVCAQVLGGRASRTTHPQTLWRMQSLFSRVLGRQIKIENPYLWQTKTDVTASARAMGLGDLIGQTVSCAHTWETTTAQPHCGKCSQCIDRRLAAVAAGLTEAEDPEGRYRVPVLSGTFTGVEHRTMVERVVGMAYHVSGMHEPAQLFTGFGEASRVLRYLQESPHTVAGKVFKLYYRHAIQVREAIHIARDTTTKTNIANRDCLLQISSDSKSRNDQPPHVELFAPTAVDVRILRLLSTRLVACKITDLAASVDASRKTTGERVSDLVRHRYVTYPRGARMGVTITKTGRELLAKVDAASESEHSFSEQTRKPMKV